MKQSITLIIPFILIICVYIWHSKLQDSSEEMFYIESIYIEEENYYINVKYPYTIYEDVNKYICQNIEKFMKDFECSVTRYDKVNEKYFLYICFESIISDKYLNFVFDIQKNIGGLHPENNIFTVSFDTKSKSLITIDELKNKYGNYLEKVSKICYKKLKEIEKIQECGAYMLLEYGTKGTKENYSDYIITKNYIEILFEHSKVAPYSLGIFRVIIPINELI